ncbi:SDR family NAD(P)-dependent oxidoreductase [Mycobacterium sp.]|uniref:SDR family NAD(P)-dependent oxidoreductase n=1 Tax=Mycobacterium sp. TaxID=1785 RepID=UPI002DA72733|nr:SDR family NAD(P)-dependent oxidoreductase [Mycobacterium sp.]
MTSTSSPVIVVVGAGPGLGLSVAHRFGAEGYAVALVSRSSARHARYLRSLADAGVDAAAFTADAADPTALRAAIGATRARFGRIDVGYFGPAAVTQLFGDITTLDAAGAESAVRGVVPAVDFASLLIPEFTARGDGGLLFAGGLSSVVPMPSLGGLALFAAALRNYAITLHAALEPAGVYAGTITIGGLIERGDIHQAMQGNPDLFGAAAVETLNPDDLADTAWRLYNERNDAEAVVNALRV